MILKQKKLVKNGYLIIKKDFREKPIDHLYDNKQTAAALQTSLLRVLAERAGWKVVESSVLYIEADVKDYGVERGGNFAYENFNLKSEIPLDYLYTEIGKLLKFKKNVDISGVKIKEEGKNNTINDLISDISGQDNFDDYRNVEKVITAMLNQFHYDEAGKRYFKDRIGAKRYYTSEDREKQREQLREVFEDGKKFSGKLASDLIEYFKKEKKKWPSFVEGSEIVRRQANNILAGLDQETHTLERLRDRYGFEDYSSDLLLAVNKKTGVGRLIDITRLNPNKIDINPEDSGSTTIFGKDLRDKTILKEFNIEGLKATDQNFRLLRATIAAMELKHLNIVNEIEAITSGVINGQTIDGKLVQVVSVPMKQC